MSLLGPSGHGRLRGRGGHRAQTEAAGNLFTAVGPTVGARMRSTSVVDKLRGNHVPVPRGEPIQPTLQWHHHRTFPSRQMLRSSRLRLGRHTIRKRHAEQHERKIASCLHDITPQKSESNSEMRGRVRLRRTLVSI